MKYIAALPSKTLSTTDLLEIAAMAQSVHSARLAAVSCVQLRLDN